MESQKKINSDQWQLHVLLLPAVLLVLIFTYLPFGGLIIAFQNYKPYLGISGSKWVGLEHFQFMFSMPDSVQVIWNTLILALFKIFFITLISVIFALLINEVRQKVIKRWVQTLVYFPHFLSWVVLGGIFSQLLSVDGGLVNQMLQSWFGMDPVFFLGEGNWFRFTAIFTEVWKEFGFYSIIFLAALTGINPSLYEAAEIDGATRWKQTLHITLPSILPVITVVVTLSMSYILSAGFDQIFNLYNPLVYDKGDIIDTFVYRMGLVNSNYSFATALGFFKSFISMVLIIVSYRLAYKFANYRIF
ncbi:MULTISPECIES: ABC transporter permease subunit [unclassified Paenibacillus]|uniref:ABC transporter permease n=1 Tax=unclassified Paenibacillus TaxID=185978 RepID=UPI00240758F8|nr:MULTISPECIES: ABC transporter permease subunit [unclassified Paenibacillus]MDF9839521.1 putative aldouronate transport system permease protein [Paenibacillus sp. PastF-2]MDF9846102.1 putative aldouronate transport system permease protein [Paenibacillus sp. PastM-2]MDF9852675.1 putative aldouronate transport system permease protein [Paenibacillus sp. PastF-1]MDH6477594.1 putative aldouronate transport system permease protein [Paenibacillus sp. PastH-2]MDH6505337.1 putative aldouronate transp